MTTQILILVLITLFLIEFIILMNTIKRLNKENEDLNKYIKYLEKKIKKR